MVLPTGYRRHFLAATVLLFGLISLAASRTEYFWFDLVLARGIQSWNVPVVEAVMRVISWLGAGWTPWILGGSTGFVLRFFLPKRHGLAHWASIVFWAGLGAGSLVIRVLKNLVMRPRPAEGLIRIAGDFHGLSFPSGHCIFFVQFFGFLAFLVLVLSAHSRFGKLLAGALLLPVLLVGVSRVYLGAHWPSDVLGGYLAGILLLWLMIAWFTRRTGCAKGPA